MAAADLALPAPAEGSAEVAVRVARARALQAARAEAHGGDAPTINARADGTYLDRAAALNDPARALLTRAADAGHLTARGWTRAIRLARTIADLEDADSVGRIHVAEALIYRRVGAGAEAAT